MKWVNSILPLFLFLFLFLFWIILLWINTRFKINIVNFIATLKNEMSPNCSSTFYSHEKDFNFWLSTAIMRQRISIENRLKHESNYYCMSSNQYCHYDFSNRNLQRFERTIDGQKSIVLCWSRAMIRFLNTLRDIVLVPHHQPRCCQVPDRGQAHGVPRPGPGQPPHLRIELTTEFHDSFHNIRMRPRCNLREIYLRPLHGVGGEL